MHAIQRLFLESTAVLARAAPYARRSWASVWPLIADSLRRLLAAGRSVSRAGATAWQSWSARRRATVCLAVAGALLAIVWLRGCNGRVRQASETPVQLTATTPATNERLAAKSKEAGAEQNARPLQVLDKPPAHAGNASDRSSEPARKERITVLKPVQPVSENRTDPRQLLTSSLADVMDAYNRARDSAQKVWESTGQPVPADPEQLLREVDRLVGGESRDATR